MTRPPEIVHNFRFLEDSYILIAFGNCDFAPQNHRESR